VIEKGITIEGKTLQEQLETVNHIRALTYIATLADKTPQDITQHTILAIHGHILAHINDSYAGRYRNIPVRITGSSVVMPNPLKVPSLMDEYISWLHTTKDHPVKIASEAHYKLVTIHPFIDGNGRTARLIMNLILSQAGYPPAIIQNEERRAYIESIEKAQLGGSLTDFHTLITQSIERSLDIYLNAVQNKPDTTPPPVLLKIGELAKATNEPVPTIRYWTQQGLLQPLRYTQGKYALYASNAIDQVNHIRKLQKEQRLTIEEIKRKIK
jgi:Fic family protein